MTERMMRSSNSLVGRSIPDSPPPTSGNTNAEPPRETLAFFHNPLKACHKVGTSAYALYVSASVLVRAKQR